jgi:hypothetical protein
MNITSSSASLNQLLELVGTSGVSGTSAPTSTSSTASTSTTAGSDSASLSDPGKLFQELDALSQSNPTEFKKITAELSQELQKAASSSSDSGQSNFLTEMASNFEKASQSGNFSDLFPSGSQQQAGSTTGSSNSTSSTSAPPSPFGDNSSGASSASTHDMLSTIFSNALSQIQSDLGSTSSSSSTTSFS